MGIKKCQTCKKKDAVSRDGKLCMRCLRRRIDSMNNFAMPVINEMADRRQLSTLMLGEVSERRDEEMDE